MTEVSQKDIGRKAAIFWSLGKQKKMKVGKIHMVGPTYIGLAIQYPSTMTGEGKPSHYYNGITRDSITKLVFLD